MQIKKKFTWDDDRISIIDGDTRVQIEVIRTPEGYIVDFYKLSEDYLEHSHVKSMQVWDDECGNDDYKWEE